MVSWKQSLSPDEEQNGSGWLDYRYKNRNSNLDNKLDNKNVNGIGVAQGIASAVNGIAGAALSTFNSTSSLDGNAQDTVNNINTTQNAISNMQTNTVSDWLTSMDSLPTALDYTNYSNVWGSKGNKALSTITGSMQAAGAGASAGPWGILAGGITGLGAGIAGIFTGKQKAKRLANNLNDVTTALNESINASKINATNQTIQHLYNDDMRNITALGGPIVTRNSGVLSPFGNRFALGGTNGTDFNNGVTTFNTGGTHEENPNEGIQIGVDNQGTPNLVEQGEAMMNNYVYSDRLKVPKEIKEKYKLGTSKDLTYADAIKNAAKESEERPNDPMSKAALQQIGQILAASQEEEKLKEKLKDPAFKAQMLAAVAQESQPQVTNIPEDEAAQYQESQQQAMETPTEQYALGGKVNRFDDGGWQMENMWDNLKFSPSKKAGNIPYDPSAKGNIASNVTPEQYAAFTNYAKTLPDTDTYWQTLANNTGKTIADLRTNYDAWRTDGKYGWVSVTPDFIPKISTQAPTPLTVNGNIKGLSPTIETVPSPLETSIKTGDINPINNNPTNEVDMNTIKPLPTWMRYAPVVGAGINVLTDALGLTNKPDYTEANMLMNAASQAGKYSPIQGQYIGNYLRYNPFDINYATNTLAQQSTAANRNIANTSGGNRAAALAAQSNANYQNQLAIANALRQSIDANNTQRAQVTEFNRGTDQFNAQQANSIAQANQAALMQSRNSYLNGVAQAAALRQKERLLADQTRGANLTNLFNNIGNIGKDNWARNQVLANAVSGVFGPIAKENLPLYLAALGINSKSKRGKAATAAMTKNK